MTYQDLLEQLYELSPTQLADDVTVNISDEFHGNVSLAINKGNDVLHDNHIYIRVHDQTIN